MARFVALLRGINVGRAKRIPMAELRALIESLGFSGARTLLNSGNVVFDGTRGTPAGHATRIAKAIASRFGFDVVVVVKSAADMAAIEAGNELGAIAKDPARLLVAFAQEPRSAADLAPVAALVQAPERLHLGKHAAYLWCANGILTSKAGVALLGGPRSVVTTRNWATLLKISAMLEEDG